MLAGTDSCEDPGRRGEAEGQVGQVEPSSTKPSGRALGTREPLSPAPPSALKGLQDVASWDAPP